ncbi:MAG TPA: FAD-dependent monooxygenase, partial [Allosphingosinicella sp.]
MTAIGAIDSPALAEADVAILGAGPAGCAAAITAASAGARVTLIEARCFPRAAPGETLPPGAEPLLRQLGLWDEVVASGFHRHEGIWVERNGKARFEAYGADEAGPWRGLQAERSRFDALLLERARQAGAVVLQPARPIGVTIADEVRLRTDAGELRTRWLIDAAGSGHWLARRLGLE